MATKLSTLLRTTLLLGAVSILPAATAGLAAVDGRSGPEFGKLYTIYQLVKANYVDKTDDDKLRRVDLSVRGPGQKDGSLARQSGFLTEHKQDTTT